MKKPIAVIIATFQAEPWIRNCLNSVLASNIPVTIYIVDNASTDHTLTILKQEYAQQIHLHCSPKNLGFGKANNIALKQAYQDGYNYFFLLNQDAYVAPNTLSLLYQAITQQAGFYIVSPFHLNGDGTLPDPMFEQFIQPQGVPELLQDYKNNMVANTIYKTGIVNAAAWLVSRSCLDEVGLFNPAFFHYGEDVNFFHRLSHHGLSIGVYAKSTIRHNKKYSTAPLIQQQIDYNHRVYYLLELSHPRRSNTFAGLVLELSGKWVIAFFSGRFSRANSLFQKWKVLITINPWQVNRCRRKTLQKGKTFFEETPCF